MTPTNLVVLNPRRLEVAFVRPDGRTLTRQTDRYFELGIPEAGDYVLGSPAPRTAAPSQYLVVLYARDSRPLQWFDYDLTGQALVLLRGRGGLLPADVDEFSATEPGRTYHLSPFSDTGQCEIQWSVYDPTGAAVLRNRPGCDFGGVLSHRREESIGSGSKPWARPAFCSTPGAAKLATTQWTSPPRTRTAAARIRESRGRWSRVMPPNTNSPSLRVNLGACSVKPAVALPGLWSSRVAPRCSRRTVRARSSSPLRPRASCPAATSRPWVLPREPDC